VITSVLTTLCVKKRPTFDLI